MSKQTGDFSQPDTRPVARSKKRVGQWELWYRFSADPDDRCKWRNQWFKHRSYRSKEMAMAVLEKMKREYNWSTLGRLETGRGAEYVICTEHDRPTKEKGPDVPAEAST